jgi:hypothetical protein
MPPVLKNEKELETAGPRTGNLKINNSRIIPMVKRAAPAKIMLNLFLKK